jgi:hypothetical protein
MRKEKGVDFQIGHAYFLKDNSLADEPTTAVSDATDDMVQTTENNVAEATTTESNQTTEEENN